MTELFFRVEKLLFYKRHIFSVLSFFFVPSSVHPFRVYGICLRNCTYYFFSLRVSSPCRSVASVLRVRGSARTCALDARVSARVVHAKPSERAASFRAHTGRNVWLWLKVEKLFGVSFFRLGCSSFVVEKKKQNRKRTRMKVEVLKP